ncbi:Relaxase/Mobilisation nuclease domain-containing protein [Mucilaginibacter sp. OK268]|uniref:relaxase/mobilization nuclease domain-containing protein n=1 Tax=Mucilaginibacter sp. OK268 TaxID=1881048 RepID=UPI00088D973B|nr:relaxase/mobilization nuclease domain-containing protein [Mucilaginibacter sp. OK268]SDP86080.1 Relaxase/Mobilisation nuclease domain-containing protein [Mucilaginibacter sp. OK268]
MTADQVKGKGFRGALNYNLEKVSQGKAEILDTSFTGVNEKSIMEEVRMVRMLRPNLAKYFYHTSLNFPPDENLGNEQMNIIANEYLNNMGFDRNQYMIFRHYDAEHPHLHLLVNRIGYDGSLVSDSKDYQRSEAILRKLEKQYDLTEVISSKQAQERAMTKNELEMMKRTDAPSTKMKLQVLLKEVLSKQPATEQFISQLEAKGIDVRFNQASTGFVSGISYGFEGMQFKGQHLGNAYKWSSVKNSISYEQERDRAAVHQANLRTAAGQSATGADTDGRTIKIAQRHRRGQKTADGDPLTESQGPGRLQERISKADNRHKLSATATGNTGNGNRLSDQNDGGQYGTNKTRQQQDRQQVADQGVPDRGFISDLLGTDHSNSDMADPALTPNRRRKRKKKRGLSM